MAKVIGEIYEETDYSVFKHLAGNRAVKPSRAKKIRDSIEKVGYVLNPIIVNKEMQVIDGQGRLAALKELGLPVIYTIDENAGINECMSMNIGQTNWGIIDYIEMYASIGVEDYVRFLEVYKEFHPKGMTIDEMCGICLNRLITNGYGSSTIKNGELKFTEKQRKDARPLFEFLVRIRKPLDAIPGSGRVKKTAVAWIVRNTSCDCGRLERIIMTQYPIIDPVVDTAPLIFMGQLSELYNKRLGAKNSIFFETEYRMWLKRNTEDE